MSQKCRLLSQERTTAVPLGAYLGLDTFQGYVAVVNRAFTRDFLYDGLRWTVSVDGGMHFDSDWVHHYLPLAPAELPDSEQLRQMPEDQLCWLLRMAAHGKRPSR
jgi:hypothetical protein